MSQSIKDGTIKREPAADKVAARLARDSKRRMAKTDLGKLQALQAERERWERKQTIATNKLRAVRRQIERHAEEMARRTLETQWEGGTK